ncbi:MAG: DUF1653 domain-containing protein [Oscillospiraceae bacterium]|nr:DUF1653 domain-containing protein [Oscillospiraceae bacterium]
MSHWIEKSNIYHLYPLGFCGCERFRSEAKDLNKGRILKVIEWIPHLKSLNMNAIYFGPIFESFEHGYDTTDYYTIDKRLGTNEDFAKVCEELHKNGIRVILDGVFNHVGRDHFAFKDLQQNGQNSRYKDWFAGVNFGGRSPYGDSFSYDGWNGCYNLVKLNLYNNEVVEHLFGAVKMWIEKWGIDGIRFDAADCLTDDFIRRIHTLTRSMRPDFWLMGEIIHGQYNHWANPEMFDCVTNYQCYKGIYSSHNDRNYFEIAHSIDYQNGQYGNLYMYNFLDNHDVSRLMSVLKDPARVECCYTMMYGMYGVPSIYYGSEFGIYGAKGHGAEADLPVRPCLDLNNIPDRNDELLKHISALGAIRLSTPAIQSGGYSKMELRNQTFSFKREKDGEEVYILLNVSDGDYTFRFNTKYGKLVDLLTGKTFGGGNAEICVPKNKSMIIADGSKAVEIPEPETIEVKVEAPAEPAPAPVASVVEVKEEPAPKNNGVVGIGVPEGRKIVLGGHYKHFKGGDYVVLNVAKDSETLEEMVVYMQIYDKPTVWVRPLKLFLEDVDDHGNIKPRFAFVE